MATPPLICWPTAEKQGIEGWSVSSGTLEAMSSPVHGGQLAGRFTATGQPSAQFAYQLVYVQPNQTYEWSGWAAAAGDAISGLFLRISWHDGRGQPLLHSDSDWLPQPDGNYYRLTTGARLSPGAAGYARVSAYALGNSTSQYTVHLDDFSFSGPAAIPLPPPAPTATATPAPGAPSPTVTPGPLSPTRTPGTQTPVPIATATPAPAFEPLVFPHLVNGGFEELREDGTPSASI